MVSSFLTQQKHDFTFDYIFFCSNWEVETEWYIKFPAFIIQPYQRYQLIRDPFYHVCFCYHVWVSDELLEHASDLQVEAKF